MAVNACPAGELADAIPNDDVPHRPQLMGDPIAEDEVIEYPESLPDSAELPSRQRILARFLPRSPVGWALLAGTAMVLGLTALASWTGLHMHRAQLADHQRQMFLEAGRQGAINLTSIDFHHADADVQRILDGATGQFYDDFNKRSKSFIDVVRQTQSTSAGAVTGAGLESVTADGADVLVAVTVTTSNVAAPQSDPMLWRMRISVQRLGEQIKVSNVSFVP